MVRDALENDPRRLASWNASANAIRPVIAFLIDAGVGCQEALRLVRWVYVREAAARQLASGSKPTISRIAAATGLSRAEVSQVLADEPAESPPTDFAPRSSDRIVAAWMSDPDYLEPNGDPKVLPYSDRGPCFCGLVRQYGADIPPRAMLNEMIASKLLVEVEPGRYLPVTTLAHPEQSESDAIDAFGLKMKSLGFALLHNMAAENGAPVYEKLLLAANVSEHQFPKLARELERRSKTFAQAVERYLLDYTESKPRSNSNDSPRGIGVLLAVIHHRELKPPGETAQET